MVGISMWFKLAFSLLVKLDVFKYLKTFCLSFVNHLYMIFVHFSIRLFASSPHDLYIIGRFSLYNK